MKMVIVFDTNDQQGMMNTVKIVDQLAVDYLGKNVDARYKRTFSKIEFIKMLRSFAQDVKRAVQDDSTDDRKRVESDGSGLCCELRQSLFRKGLGRKGNRSWCKMADTREKARRILVNRF